MAEKDLEKLTATKLREIAKQYEGITGVHAMKKEELIQAIQEAQGEPRKTIKKDKAQSIGSLKKQIKALKEQKKAAQEKRDKKMITAIRKKIKRFRRLTRKMIKVRA